MNLHELIDRLHKEHTLTRGEFITLIKERDEENASYLASLAREEAVKIYGNGVFPRGLVEFTNYCKNNCYYCGIQGSNQHANRYRLSKDEILSACENGYQLGYRSFVLQGGEDPHDSDDVMVPIVSEIRKRYQDCAITLSLGERSKESYQKLYDAGADRYLLRHEAATPELYQKLHPESLSLENRIQCLWNLKEIGYADLWLVHLIRLLRILWMTFYLFKNLILKWLESDLLYLIMIQNLKIILLELWSSPLI